METILTAVLLAHQFIILGYILKCDRLEIQLNELKQPHSKE